MSTSAKISKSPTPAARAERQSGGRKSGERGASLTSEHIAAHLAAFRKTGGKIEVLDNTRTLKKIGVGPQSGTQPANGGTAEKKAAR